MRKLGKLSAAVLALGSAWVWAGAPDAGSLGNSLSLRVAVDSNRGAAAGAPCADLGADWALCLKGRLILQNKGGNAIAAGSGWSLYLHSIRRILKLDTPQFAIRHITGDLYQLTPTAAFQGLAAGQRLELPLIDEYWLLQESDVLPRPYVVVDGQPPVLLSDNSSDDASYLLPLAGDNWKNPAGEQRPLVTLEQRYLNFTQRGPQLSAAQVANRVIPAVKRQQLGGGQLNVRGLSFNLSGLSWEQGQALSTRAAQLGLREGGVRLEGKVVGSSLPADVAVAGGYRLRIGERGVVVEGYDAAGVFYGVQTLFGLLPQQGGKVQWMTVEDAPRYGYRGLMADLARNFKHPATLHRLLDQMSAYKLNKLHLHLSDDEGWRLQIPGLPELTAVGGRRCHDLSETRCLLPQLGSGPDNQSGGGYLSRDEYINLVRYAQARFIEVIPEFDMPAHARAAVVSMEARYRRLSAEGKPQAAEEYRLLDPQDKSNTLSVQFYDHRTYLNPCVPGSERFVAKLVSEVAQMHREAGQPLQTWHFGGDEAKNILLGGGFQDVSGSDPGKGKVKMSEQDKPWGRSPACQAQIAKGTLRSVDDLPLRFAQTASRIVAQQGIATMAAWQDGVSGASASSDFATQHTMVTEWGTVFWGAAQAANGFAAKGFQTVLAMPDYLYFDFPYELNPREHGYYWASRDTDSYKVFSFAPDNLPQNAEVMPDRQGQPFAVTSSAAPARFAGMQGQAWGEIVRNDATFEQRVYPRMLALAERAWHQAAWERPYKVGETYQLGMTHLVDKAALNADWQQFAAVLGWREAPKLERAGVGYRVPLPAVAQGANGLAVTCEWPGARLQYSNDGQSWQVYQPGQNVQARYWRGASQDGMRFSRVEGQSQQR
ncbi:family 20 glycosylhydrolase [Chromobacterium sp. IIBBL 290-4]|uniref:family 20 glycosylhydrolase n=1 Tax=Chromobacterium sp. IIBBL 290-4 TaxID=2953890 RepID=UPI0020B6F1DD|nr:family 20 glycosylhydrolase [Chromobacterium sp. IIBBL 290-4]UTH74572.1 carbohydate-binding domain-containing protein [Chromobacterium sp. IIBBL 290-4]